MNDKRIRVFMAGDAVTGTGPANVTKHYIEKLPKGTLYQKMRSKIARVPEILIKTLRADVVVYSGYSRQNILGMKWAMKVGRPTAYLMHGCVEYENEINLEVDDEMTLVERSTLEMTDMIIAVSASFEKWLKERYPEYENKIFHVTNGIDTELFRHAKKRKKRPRKMVLSIGGGMPRKRIVKIAEAVDILREEYDKDVYLCVIGDKGADTDAIAAHDHVQDLGIVPFDKTVQLFEEAAVFVQNSCFETFGLAPIEALTCGCPILCEQNIGALELLYGYGEGDIIKDWNDEREIAEKIKNIMEQPNAERLMSALDAESCSWKERSETLMRLLSKLVFAK